MKNIIAKVVNAVSIIIIALSIFLLLNVVMTKSGSVPSVAGYSMLRVLTGSMEPEIPADSILIIHKVDPADIKPGDVISFYSPDPSLGGALNTHRVVDVTAEDGTLFFETKGDANLVADAYPVPAKAVVGMALWHSYLIGRIFRLISNPLVFVPLILVPLAVLVVLNAIKAVRSAKELMQQEEDAAIQAAIEAARKKREQQDKIE